MNDSTLPLTGIDWETPPPRGYRRNARGDLVHERNISETDRDMDAVTRLIHGFGQTLSAQMWRFRVHTLDDIYAFIDRVIERYGGKIGGRKGNVQITTFNGLLRVQLAQAEEIAAGPEISAAQAIIEECIAEWSVRGNVKLRALVDQAFRTDATGQVSVTQLLRLRRTQIDDPRWREAQAAISDALRPVGRSEYVRLYRRETPAQPWRQVPLHLAAVTRPVEDPGTPAAQLERRMRSAVEEARRAGMGAQAIADVFRVAKTRPER